MQAGLSAPHDHIYSLCTLSDHNVLLDTDSQTQRNKWRRTHTPTPIHLSILGIQFSPLVLLCFSKWMIKSTMRFKSSGMCGLCQRPVRQPGGSKVTSREELGSPLPSLKSTFICINLSSTGQENILRPKVMISASNLLRALQRFLCPLLWGENSSGRQSWESTDLQ